MQTVCFFLSCVVGPDKLCEAQLIGFFFLLVFSFQFIKSSDQYVVVAPASGGFCVRHSVCNKYK